MRSQHVLGNVEKILQKLSLTSADECTGDKVLNYCTNDTTEDFEKKILKDFLANLQRFDLRSREQKPLMAKARRRLVFGASETKKYLEMDKIVAVIIPRDLTDEMLLDPDFRVVLKQDSRIIKIYALTRRQLGRALISNTASIGMIGVLKVEGVEEQWKTIQEEFKNLKKSWTDRWLQSSNWINEDGESFIWLCSYYGHEDLLRALPPDAVPFLNRGCSYNGKTPLIVAAERGHLNVVKFLLDRGADEDISDFSLNRPIHVVESAEIAALLTYFDKKNATGYNPIENAIVRQNLHVTQYFIAELGSSEQEALHLLFLSAKLKTVQLFDLLSNTFKLPLENIRDPLSGNTILMTAVENSSYEVFKYLVNKIEDVPSIVHVRNLKDEDIFQIANRVNDVGITRKLIKYKEQ